MQLGVRIMLSKYTIISTTKSRCPECNNLVDMLGHSIRITNHPIFYICWTCHRVYEIGKGEALRDG
jgi:uncharacterized protein with PIN domain